jgi:hypothetical protein
MNVNSEVIEGHGSRWREAKNLPPHPNPADFWKKIKIK